MPKIKISAVVLVRNEEEVIIDCLESVKWTDEIMIVDHQSAGKTLEIIKKAEKAKIVKAPEETTFADRRNLGAKTATGKWLLYVDADERVTPVLKEEIKKIITDPGGFSAFAIPRRNIRLTKELKHGGWWPDYVLRLIKKDKLITWEGELHEQPKIDGEVGKLKEAFVHFSHRGSFENKLQNTINWSKIEAQRMFNANHPPMTIPRFLSAMWREFYYRMIKHQAFRDGTEGIMEAFYQVFSVFISYARLWEIQNEKNIKN